MVPTPLDADRLADTGAAPNDLVGSDDPQRIVTDVGGYSPRVPAIPASAIFERARGDLSVALIDGELGVAGHLAVGARIVV